MDLERIYGSFKNISPSLYRFLYALQIGRRIIILDFLPFYAILRSIPDKLGGVVGMFAAILILLALPILDVSRIRSNAFRPIMKFFFWLFVANFLLLGWIGGNHAEEPYITIGQVCTIFYFSYFLILVPAIGIIENTLIDLATKKNNY